MFATTESHSILLPSDGALCGVVWHDRAHVHLHDTIGAEARLLDVALGQCVSGVHLQQHMWENQHKTVQNRNDIHRDEHEKRK